MNKGECLFPSKNYTWGSYRKEAPKAKKTALNYAPTERHQKAERTLKEQKTLITPNINPNNGRKEIERNFFYSWGHF